MSGGDVKAAGDEAGGFLSRWARRKQRARAGVAAADAVAPEAAAAPRASDAPRPAAVPAASAVPAAHGQSEALAGAPLDAPAAGRAVTEPLPTMADVALLTRESDYARFVAPGIDNGVKQAAMKKLFADPHFNVMDGLDTYIDDYSQPDPIPLAMLRRMNQSKFLGLFDHEEADDANSEGRNAEDPGAEANNAEANAPARAATAGITATPSATVASTPAGAAPAPAEPEDPRDDHADLRLQQDDAAGRPGPAEGARA